MKATEGKLEKQVQFWSLLGPFFILLTLFITLVRVSPTNVYLGFIALAAIPICWKWKMYGLASIIGVIAALIAYNYSELTTIERFWQVGVGIAISVGCIVTTLSFEEAENLIQSVKVQSDSRLDNLWHLDEKLKNLKETYETEKENLTQELETALTNVRKVTHELDSYEKLARIHREELQVAQEEKNKLLEEIFQTKTQSAQLQEQLDNYNPQQIETYTRNLEEVNGNYQTFKTQVSELQEQIKSKQEKELQLEKQIDKLQIKVKTYQTTQTKVDSTETEKSLRQAEGKYRQLTRQFKEKSETLDSTRKELFQTQEKLLAAKRDTKEFQVYGHKEFESEMEKYVVKLHNKMENNSQQYQQEIDSLHQLVSKLMKN